MKTVLCVLCGREETFNESECVFGFLAAKDRFSLSGEYQEKPFVCISCLAKSEGEHETARLFAARVKAGIEAIKTHEGKCCKFAGEAGKKCSCKCHSPQFEYAVVLIMDKEGEKRVRVHRILKDEDLKRYAQGLAARLEREVKYEEAVFGVFPASALDKAEALRVSKG